MAKTKSSRVVVGARLLHVVDNYLRRKQRGRGDMSALIHQALREVDLGSVQLITIQGQRRQVTARPTKIVLPTDVRDQLDRWSEARACSIGEALAFRRTGNTVLSWLSYKVVFPAPAVPARRMSTGFCAVGFSLTELSLTDFGTTVRHSRARSSNASSDLDLCAHSAGVSFCGPIMPNAQTLLSDVPQMRFP